MTFRLATAAALAALLATSSAFAAPVDLVTNGSFEDNLQAAGTWNIYANLTGWTGGANGIELRNDVAGTAYDGVNFVELDTNHNSLMYQDLATTAGQTYQVSFAYSPRTGVSADSNPISVYWEGNLVNTYTGTTSANTDWTVYTLDLKATTNGSQLQFKAVGTDDSYGGSLDKISVTAAVPEPETYAMLLAGLGLVGFAARRKKRA